MNPENYVVSLWLKKLKEIFIGDYVWEYFQIHYTFSDLYFSDLDFAKIINNMVQKSEENPHSIITRGFKKRLDSFLYKRPVEKESKLKSLESGKYEIKMLKDLIYKKPSLSSKIHKMFFFIKKLIKLRIFKYLKFFKLFS